MLSFLKEPCPNCDGQTSMSKMAFADSMLYQSNLFQNATGLRNYPWMDKRIFHCQVSFKLEFFSKLNWLFYYLS